MNDLPIPPKSWRFKRGMPTPNPIDLGLVDRWTPIDYLGPIVASCKSCSYAGPLFGYKMIRGDYVGVSRSLVAMVISATESTQGKRGNTTLHALCQSCSKMHTLG